MLLRDHNPYLYLPNYSGFIKSFGTLIIRPAHSITEKRSRFGARGRQDFNKKFNVQISSRGEPTKHPVSWNRPVVLVILPLDLDLVRIFFFGHASFFGATYSLSHSTLPWQLSVRFPPAALQSGALPVSVRLSCRQLPLLGWLAWFLLKSHQSRSARHAPHSQLRPPVFSGLLDLWARSSPSWIWLWSVLPHIYGVKPCQAL